MSRSPAPVAVGHQWLPLAIVAVTLVGLLTACGSEPADADLPDGVAVTIDQSRMLRSTREVFLRVENETDQDLTIERFELTSPRLEAVRWEGSEVIGATYETDLEFTMPPGRCGDELAAQVELVYRIGGGGQHTSLAPVDDPYGNATELVNRDCAEDAIDEAAEVVVGDPQVVGTGRTAELHLPVTMTPTGRRTDVRFTGFGSTPLFRQAAGSPVDVDVPLAQRTSPVTMTMQVVPARCDQHALAEDKVGRLFAVNLIADELPAGGSYFLALTDAQRTAFYSYFRVRCPSS